MITITGRDLHKALLLQLPRADGRRRPELP
jgi:hypothetical protein